VNRREFIIRAGAFGLLVTFSSPFIPNASAADVPLKAPRLPKASTDFNAYLKIGATGRVECFLGKVEMGQGLMTAFAMMVADELDVRFDHVDVVAGDTDLCPWDMGTWGSLATWQTGPVVRSMAAEARAVLLQLASERFGVPVEKLRLKDSVVSVSTNSSKRVTYAELVDGKRIERHMLDAKVKEISQLKVIGTEAPRKDGYAKVTGAAKYAADIILPGMMYAALLRPPYIGARLISADTTDAEKVPGVKVVRLNDVVDAVNPQANMDHPGAALEELGRSIVAVLHRSLDVARDAVATVKALWTPSPWKLDDKNVYEHLLKAAPPAKQVVAKGSIITGEAETVKFSEATYQTSYVAHATIETHAAVAKWETDRVTVWASTQAPFVARTQVAQALSLDPKNVRIITPFLGGGFGGKSGVPQGVEAARLSQAVGCPVQVAWTREEEFLLDTYRPAAIVKCRSGLDRDGRISFWDFHTYCAGDRESETFYEIPHQLIQASGGWTTFPAGLHPFGIGPWRGPSATTNVFARESHIDSLAVIAAMDPLEFRLRHVAEPRPAAVLRAVAKLFNWKPMVAPSGRGFGISTVDMHNSIVAAMAEVDVDKKTGNVKVKRVAMAVDIGQVINPELVRQQMEGCITMGLGSCLTEEIHFENAIIKDTNFDTYEIPHFSWLPKIQTTIVNNPDVPSQGIGEPPMSVMGGLIANAIHDAVGVRVLQLPITPQRILEALEARN
jgi:nicotinate dehydrogenase subunit B